MPTDDPEFFGYVTNWFYGQPLHLTEEGPEPLDLINLYIMADRLILPNIKNQIVDTLRAYFARKSVMYITMGRLITADLQESKAMAYLVDEAGLDLSKMYKKVWDVNHPTELCALDADVVKRIMDRWSATTSLSREQARREGCYYHEHQSNEERAECKEAKPKK